MKDINTNMLSKAKKKKKSTELTFPASAVATRFEVAIERNINT